MLNTCRTLPAVVLLALSCAVPSLADSELVGSGLSEAAATLLADSGNPWALPAPQTDPYSEPVQPYQRGSRFITPEELNSIYKQPDQGKQEMRSDPSSSYGYMRRYYSPGPSFDPLQPGAIYPGIEGGIYSPYGMSPFYTPNNFNNVAPFIY